MDTFNAIQLAKLGNPKKAFRFIEKFRPNLNPNEVRIRVDCFGINFADILTRQGLYPEAPALPFIPGYEVVGFVIEVGDGVESVKVGDRIVSGTLFNGYAQEVVVPEYNTLKISSEIAAPAALSLVAQGQTAVQLFENATRVFPEDLVYISAAASGVGIYLCQMALHRGCRVIASCGSESKVQFLKEMGVTLAINYRTQNFVREIKRTFPSEKIDVAFDSLGGSSLRKTWTLLGTGGRLLSYGIAEVAGSRWKKLGLAVTALSGGFLPTISLLSHSKAFAGVNMLKLARAKPHVVRAAYLRAHELLQKGEIRSPEGKLFPVSELSDAHALVENRGVIGKVAVQWN